MRRFGRFGAGWRVCGLLWLLACWPAMSSAQTSTFRLGWGQTPTATETFASLASYQYTLKIDANPATVVIATCTQAPAPATAHPCTTPLPPMPSGTHTLTLTAFNGFGQTSSAPFSGGPPNAPIIITVSVTVTVP